jgi:succinate dehydrogenase / fumarate reductase iron-sulfur subunit
MDMDGEKAITVRVWRWRPETEAAGRLEEHRVASAAPLSVMALLARVHEVDGTFCCRTATCFKGRCGSCLVRVDGKDVFGCTTLVRPGETVTVEPHSRFAVIRDVAVDFARPAAAGKGAGE